MKVYFMRHGETDWNTAHRLQGRTDIPLNENGIRAAKECGKKLSDTEFGLCITSPLKRAVETASLILSENHGPLPEAEETHWKSGKTGRMHGIALFTDERLVEYCFGEWEGKINKGPGYELPIPEYGLYWQSLEDDRKAPGMEGKEALTARVRSFLDELTETYGTRDINVLVVAHGGVMRAVKVINDDETDTFNIRVPGNCEYVILEPDEMAEKAQKQRGIPEGSLKYGRKLKFIGCQTENKEC